MSIGEEKRRRKLRKSFGEGKCHCGRQTHRHYCEDRARGERSRFDGWASFWAERRCGMKICRKQSSYLPQISRFISVEKKLSCGEISDFCKQFMEYYRNLCRFCSKFVWRKICVEKISVEKKWQIWGLLCFITNARARNRRNTKGQKVHAGIKIS